MTREEAIKYFKRHLDLYCVDGISREAEEMAIQALKQNESAEEWYKLFVEKLDEQEPTDAISRILKRMWNCRGKHTTSIDKVAMEQIIRDELSVTQKPIECEDAISREAAINIASLHCMTIDETVKALEKLPSVTQKWVNVNDMLPRKREDVLVTCFIHENWQTKIGYWNGKAWVVNAYDILFIDRLEVVAWMPLPKPYEPQGRSDKK